MDSQPHAPSRFTPRKQTWYPLHRGWLSQKAGLDAYEEHKISCSFRGSNSGQPRLKRVVTSSQNYAWQCISTESRNEHKMTVWHLNLGTGKRLGVCDIGAESDLCIIGASPQIVPSRIQYSVLRYLNRYEVILFM